MKSKLKYSIGTKVLFHHNGKTELYYIHDYQAFSNGGYSAFERYVIKRESDNHIISMVSEESLRSLVEVRDEKIDDILNG